MVKVGCWLRSEGVHINGKDKAKCSTRKLERLNKDTRKEPYKCFSSRNVCVFSICQPTRPAKHPCHFLDSS